MNIKKMLCILSLSVCLSVAIISKTKAAINSERIWGLNRYDTSIAISQNGWNTNSDYVIIANGEEFGDELIAVPLAKKYNAPLLLVSRDKLDNQSDSVSNVTNELSRLKVKKAVIIGGMESISPKVEDDIKDKGIETDRIDGKDRYSIEIQVAKRVGTSNGIIVVSEEDFSDALSVASIAAEDSMPIILVSKDKVTDETKSYLKNAYIPKTYVIGDSDFIDNDMVKQLPNIERIIENSKYQRRLNILSKFSKDIKYNTVYLASSKGFSDSLSGSVLAALTDSPIILVDEDSEDSVQEFIKDKIKDINQINILGGEEVISDSLLAKIIPVIKKQSTTGELLKRYLKQGNTDSTEKKEAVKVSDNKESLVNKEQTLLNNSGITLNSEVDSKGDKIVSDAQENINVQVAGVNMQTTAWVALNTEGSKSKIEEVIKIPPLVSQYMPIEFANKQYMIIDPEQISSDPINRVDDKVGLTDFRNNFRPQFHNFMEKYLESYNQGFKFVNYNGLMRINTKNEIKYAQTYQLRLNDIAFKSLINYATSDRVQDKEIISFMKQIMLSCVDLSESGDKEEQKKKIENIFAEMALEPEKSMKKIRAFVDAIDGLKLIGDKGLDITYNICDGYIIGESGIADLQIDTRKLVDVIDKLNRCEISSAKEIKNILSFNYNMEKNTETVIPELTKDNSFNYTDFIKLEGNGFKKLKVNKVQR